MSKTNEHQIRLRREVELLEKLKKSSSIFDFVGTGDPLNELTITFNGKGLFLKDSVNDDVEFIDVHRIEIRLPTAYPKTEPDVRWLTPVFHPNISFSGFVNLEEIGLKWQPEMTLDALCDRLWDVARLAHLNLSSASNYTAKKWYESECALKLPIDARPLQNRSTAEPENVVSYRRLGDSKQDPQRLVSQGVMFIGDETGKTVQPENVPGAVADDAATSTPADQDEGIYFIG